MARAITIGPLELAAIGAAKGGQDYKLRYEDTLKLSSDGDIDNAIRFLVSSCDGAEPNFLLILKSLISKSSHGYEVVKEAALSGESGACEKLSKQFITNAQKEDFFQICSQGSAEDIKSAINEIGIGLALKMVNEKGENALDIAIKYNKNVDLAIFKEYGFKDIEQRNSEDSSTKKQSFKITEAVIYSRFVVEKKI